MTNNDYKHVIRDLSEQLIAAQRPIRILDALKWNETIKENFFKNKFKVLPAIDEKFYEQNPLRFDPHEKIAEFLQIESEIKRSLGQYNEVGLIMQRLCREYSLVVEMLRTRGTKEFTKYSKYLYGSSTDTFYIGAPSLKDLAILLSNTLAFLHKQTKNPDDQKKI